jgi:hypothetical protein
VTRRRTTLPLLLSALLVTLATTTSAAFAQDRQETEYAVYSAVLRQVVLKDGWGGHPGGTRTPIGRLVILSDVRPGGGSSDRVRARLPSLDSTIAADFARKSEAKPIERQFQDVGPYELLTRAELAALPMDHDWKGFYERFPDAPGFVTFSQVGFNRASTEAVVVMSHTRAGLWGHSTAYRLRKTDDGWVITESVLLRQS